MSGLVRIDGPVKIGPNNKVDLAPYLNDVRFIDSGYEATFRVAAIVTEDDQYDFEHISTHALDNVDRLSDSLTFALDDQGPVVRTIDFGLDNSNSIFIIASDPMVKEVLLEFIDIAPI